MGCLSWVTLYSISAANTEYYGLDNFFYKRKFIWPMISVTSKFKDIRWAGLYHGKCAKLAREGGREPQVLL